MYDGGLHFHFSDEEQLNPNIKEVGSAGGKL
jgi:hypothetical protein